MTSDKLTAARRTVLRAGVVLGTLAAARVVLAPDGGAPAPEGSVRRARGVPGSAAGPPGGYRLRPMAGETSRSGPGASPPRAEVAFTLPDRGREVALTFDDGPDPRHTPEILQVLRRYGVRATFFVVGECALAFPDLLHALADEGHAIGNHTWTHPQLTALPPDAVRGELGRTSALIEEVLGAPPALARAPYGDWDPLSLAVCAELGMSPVGWSVDSQDWTRPGPERIADTVLDALGPGAIVLCHDGGGDRVQTVQALEWYLPELLDLGYDPVRVPR
ncbi:polysaccharide deacetylase family protein [Streptomyces sp. RS10V-4]|uniref:polysaccharide deacetylase family protein n=1 Tax=Streptomyces rhizoryzae TaxID=2932493 RepID=UPI0020042E16|nr:polysaccharide deacetylase family protein [Streptomyces rhizoryzae]MCK7624726.1 polysaccharide deacetylase family protein [Streptomyces rhizoryzae]